MAGYSGTPLTRKLGLRPGLRVELIGLPKDVGILLAKELAECRTRDDGPGGLDILLVFERSRAQLACQMARATVALAPDGVVWAAWPKLGSGVESELRESVVRELGLASGLVDVKVCAISGVWSGLKFVRRRRDRAVSPAAPVRGTPGARPR
ncbi:MAG TPA: DUF3052 family protein [Thermoplasmata archaeon]|nr:DUF3052 family protein [Thermoplasmata archaeon]